MKWIRILTIGSLFSFGLGFFSNSWAREWYFQPSASLQSFYDTNIRMISEQKRADNNNVNTDAFGFLTTGSANFGVRADNYDVGVGATGVIRRYITDLNNLDTENVFVTARSLLRMTERQTLGLNFGYADDTVINSVLETTATSQQNTTRTLLTINPEWRYAFSELTSVQVDYFHSDVSYGESGELEEQRFFDNTRDRGLIDLSHQWHPLLKSHAIFEATLFDIPDPAAKQTTTNYNVNLGIDYSFSETWTASLGGGVHVTDTEFTDDLGFTVTENSVGPLFTFQTEKTFEAARVAAGYYRHTIPRGAGGFSLADTSYLAYTQRLSEHFEIGLRASYNDVRSVFDFGSQNFTNYTAGASASWLISPQMNLTASHRYRFRESQEDSANNADGNAFYLTLNYKWDPFSTRKF